MSSDEEFTDLSSVVAFMREQSQGLQDLRAKLEEEHTRNNNLADKLDKMTTDMRKLQERYSSDMDAKNDEINKLSTSMEVQKEYQASIIDELRFQMQSLRNKIDSGGSRNNLLTENGRNHNGNYGSGKQPMCELSPKKLTRHNSQDSVSSTGSSPCLLSRISSPHRAEFVWRINSFTRKLKKIRSNSYDEPSRSAPFTTGPHGYRLSMWAYLNGRGKGEDKCLSLYVRINAGEYDPVLTWPAKPCYTFYLISQSSDPNKRLDLVRVRDLSLKHGGIARPEKDDKSIIVGFDDFIVHEDIEKKEFLYEDTLFIRCVVEIAQ